MGNYLAEIGGKYKINDWYKTVISYRMNNWAYGFGVHQRFDFDNTFRIKINDEKFYLRIKLQRKLYRTFVDEDNVRARLKYVHKINKKTKVFEAVERFYSIEKKEGFSNWSRQRYTGGFEYEFQKRNTLIFYYRYQNDLNKPNPKRASIVGVSYSFELK